MHIIKTLEDLASFNQTQIHTGQEISFVPTMGALHEGHLSLVHEALKHTTTAIVSIFINPTQFAPGEDLDSYPRTLDEDIKKLKSVGAHAIWLPSIDDIYPNGQKIDTHVSDISEPLEGKYRPHFFDGVATVVARLFNEVKPNKAYFGEKDFQQLQVIKKMVSDLNMPIDIIGVPTIRDENGLALSSRNSYLSKEEYNIAIYLNEILRELAHGEITEEEANKKLLEKGFDKVDYCTIRSSKTLTKNGNLDRVLAAVWLGNTRLIDNMPIFV